VYHLPIPVKCIVQKQERNNESPQGSTMDSTNTSEKAVTSSATDDKPLEGRFSYSVIHCYFRRTTQQTSLRKINVVLE